MPIADYVCRGCPGLIVRDHAFSSAVGARASAPICPVCEILMEPVPAARFDLRSDGDSRTSFQKFTVHRLGPDGQQHEEVIDSLHAARRIERDSEQRYRDGEGEPLRFRALSQDRSNRDVGSFGRAGTIGGRAYDSGQQPTTPKPVTRHGQRKPRVAVARGGGVSPLRS